MSPHSIMQFLKIIYHEKAPLPQYCFNSNLGIIMPNGLFAKRCRFAGAYIQPLKNASYPHA